MVSAQGDVPAGLLFSCSFEKGTHTLAQADRVGDEIVLRPGQAQTGFLDCRPVGNVT